MWRADGGALVDFAKALMEDERAHGSKVFPFHRAVFSGQQTHHVGWGQRDKRVLVELRGQTAHDWWDVALRMADHVSRLDVEVTVRQVPYDHSMALNIWLGDRKKAEQRGKPAKFRLQAESDGGTTLYIGRAASRYQARLYEADYKHPHQGLEECWRYEVQCRRERAAQMADLLVRSPDALSEAARRVHGHFAARGVAPIFSPSEHVRMAALPPPETDKARSLQWLASSVAPALSRHVGWGSYDQALEALGIPDS